MLREAVFTTGDILFNILVWKPIQWNDDVVNHLTRIKNSLSSGTEPRKYPWQNSTIVVSHPSTPVFGPDSFHKTKWINCRHPQINHITLPQKRIFRKTSNCCHFVKDDLIFTHELEKRPIHTFCRIKHENRRKLPHYQTGSSLGLLPDLINRISWSDYSDQQF